MKLRPQVWPRVIVTCGLYSALLSLLAVGLVALRLINDASAIDGEVPRGEPHAWLFIFLCGLLLLVSYRLVVRRAGAGVIIALLGWLSVVSMLGTFSPWSPANVLIFVVSTLVPVTGLTAALFYGEDAWKPGL